MLNTYSNNLPLINKRKSTSIGFLVIEWVIFFVSLFAAFGFSVSFIIDEEFFPTGNLTGKLVITYLICAVIGIPALVHRVRELVVKKKYPDVLVYTDPGRTTLYVYNKGDYTEIAASQLVGREDWLPAKEYHYFCGKSRSIIDCFAEARGKMTLRYKSGIIVRRIPLWVDCVNDAEDEIYSLVEANRIVECKDGPLRPLVKKTTEHWPAHFIIASVLFLGCMWLLGFLIKCEIEDIEWNGYLNVEKIVIMSVCFVVFGGFPLFLYIHNYRRHRHMPTDVILIDSYNQNYYLFRNGNYVKVPIGNIVGVNAKNYKIAIYHTYWVNYKRYDYYTHHDIAEGNLKIRYKDKNGFTHRVKYPVQDVYQAASEIER